MLPPFFFGLASGLLQLQVTENSSSQFKVKRNILALRNGKSSGVCTVASRGSKEAIWTQCLFFPSLSFHSHVGNLLRVARC